MKVPPLSRGQVATKQNPTMNHPNASDEEEDQQPVWDTPGFPQATFRERLPLVQFLQNHALAIGFSLSVTDSRQPPYLYPFAILQCSKSEAYRNRLNLTEATRKRRKDSVKSDCPFKIQCKQQTVSTRQGQRTIWTFVIKHSYHNHFACQNCIALPAARVLPKDALEHIAALHSAQIRPRFIHSSLKVKLPNLLVTRKDISNAIHKKKVQFLGDRTSLQAMFDTMQAKDYSFRQQTNEDNQLTHILCIHPKALLLSKQFKTVFCIDCTYKTNKLSLPLLHIVGVTCCHSTFTAAFGWLRNESYQDFVWALRNFESLLCDTCTPVTLVTDKDDGLIKAVETVFPTARLLLCTWHINKNVEAKGRKLLGKMELPEANLNRKVSDFMSLWCSIMKSKTELDFHERLNTLHALYSSDPYGEQLIHYLNTEWLSHKERFVCYWTDTTYHFGNGTTGRVESAHAMLKKFIQVSTGDLLTVWQAIDTAVSMQIDAFEYKFYAEKNRSCAQFTHPLFLTVIQKVSKVAIQLAHDHLQSFVQNQGNQCDCSITTVYGIPCGHFLLSLLTQNVPLSRIHFHKQWWLVLGLHDEEELLVEDSQRDTALKVFIESVASDRGFNAYQISQFQNHLQSLSSQSVPSTPLEPAVIRARGRPLGSRNRPDTSTRRDPSHFEQGQRRCSTCHQPGHNLRTCPIRNQ